MGGHYGSIHVRSEGRDAVRAAIESLTCDRTHRFLIAPPINGWVTIYPENNGQDPSVSEALAAILPDKTLIHCLVHDDDVFAYWVFQSGRTLDCYNSCPGYFGDANPPPRGGNARALAHLLTDPEKVDELQSLLDADRFDFELERQDQFAALLGLPNTAYAYEYLQAGETEGVRQWKRFIHVPDLAPEKSARRAAAAQERAELKRLQQDGVLLVDEPAKRSGNKHFFKTPLWTMDPASSSILLTWQDHGLTDSAERAWRRFSAPRWRGENWEGPAAEQALGLHFSSAGRWLVIQSQHGSQIHIWDRREERLAAQKKFAGAVTAVTFSADESWLFVVVHQPPQTHLHRVALLSGLEHAVFTDESLHFQTMAPHPDGRLLALVDNYGLLVVIEVAAMRIVNQVWIKETNPLLPEALRGALVADAQEKMLDKLKHHMSAPQLEQYRQKCARHFLPSEAIRRVVQRAALTMIPCRVRVGPGGQQQSNQFNAVTGRSQVQRGISGVNPVNDFRFVEPSLVNQACREPGVRLQQCLGLRSVVIQYGCKNCLH